MRADQIRRSIVKFAKSKGFKGVEWTEGTAPMLHLVSPQGKVRVPTKAFSGDVFAHDLFGLHEILHAEQLVSGRLVPLGDNLYVWDGILYVTENGPWAAAENVLSGEVHNIAPWEEDAMGF